MISIARKIFEMRKKSLPACLKWRKKLHGVATVFSPGSAPQLVGMTAKIWEELLGAKTSPLNDAVGRSDCPEPSPHRRGDGLSQVAAVVSLSSLCHPDIEGSFEFSVGKGEGTRRTFDMLPKNLPASGWFWGDAKAMGGGQFIEVSERLLLVLLFIVGDPAFYVIQALGHQPVIEHG